MFDHVDVQPVPGDGVLHRNDHAVILVMSKPNADQREMLSEWARQHPESPLPDVASVAALGWTDDQFYVHATGPLSVSVTSDAGNVQLELGTDDEVMSLCLSSVVTVECRHLDHRSEAPDPFAAFTTDTTSAGGFIATVQAPLPIEEQTDAEQSTVEAAQEAQQLAPPPPPPQPPPPPPLSAPQPPEPPSVPPAPAPAKNQPATADNDELSEIFVLGVSCPRCSNLNHPEAPYCYVDGHRLVETRVLRRAKRPTLGHLRLPDDGTHVQLLKPVVLGRAPDVSPLVKNNDAESVVLEDPTMSLSRSHAVVDLRDWDVYLRDDGSQNGTWLIDPNGARRKLDAGEECKLTHETMFSIGQTIITFVPAPFD